MLGRTSAAVAAVVLAAPLAACTGTDDTSSEEPAQAALAAQVLREESEPRAWGLATGRSDDAREAPLPVRPGWGPSEAQLDRAQELVDAMTLHERAGQVIVARYAGTAAPTRLVRRLHLGGVVVFSENVTGSDQIRRSNAVLQRAVRRDGRPYGITIGVDQEGGAVERVTTATRFPAFMTAGAAGRPGMTRAAAAASGAELAGLGFTTDYAPVADVTAGASDPVIGARSAAGDAAVVTEHALAAAAGFRSAGVVPVLKHFPGHGSVTEDSHLTLPEQERSVAELERTDLRPFRAGVEAGLPSVMVGHLDVRAVDPGVPASLSRPVVTGLLRERLGFEGLVVTDALNMGAVTRSHGSARSAVQALRAGADVLLMPPSPQEARAGIVRAVRDGRLPSQRLAQAATRHVALLLHQRAEGLRTRPPGSSRAVSARWSSAAVTSVDGPCSGRIVGRRVTPTGDPDAVGLFRSAARDAGLKVVNRRGTTVRLVGLGDAPARGDVVVALDAPHVLGRSRARVARLATYGQTPGAVRALVDVLAGRREAPGRLPVEVPGVPRRGC